MENNNKINSIADLKNEMNGDPPKLIKVINGTTYEVLCHFDDTSKEGIYDKILRLIEEEQI